MIVALLTGSFTIFVVGLTLWFENKSNLLEHKRWYVDHFIREKLESLRKLHVALVDCHFTMIFFGSRPPKTLVEVNEKIKPKEEEYLRSKVMVSIYLDQKENEIFSKALGAFRQASMAIWLQLPEKELSVNRDSYDAQTNNLDWRLFVDTYETALKLIGKVESKIAKRNGRCKCRQLTMQ